MKKNASVLYRSIDRKLFIFTVSVALESASKYGSLFLP